MPVSNCDLPAVATRWSSEPGSSHPEHRQRGKRRGEWKIYTVYLNISWFMLIQLSFPSTTTWLLDGPRMMTTATDNGKLAPIKHNETGPKRVCKLLKWKRSDMLMPAYQFISMSPSSCPLTEPNFNWTPRPQKMFAHMVRPSIMPPPWSRRPRWQSYSHSWK